MKKTALYLAMMTLMPAAAALAETHGDWTTHKEDGRCWASTFPRLTEGNINGRQDPFLSITNFPSEGVASSIAVVAGYDGAGEGKAVFSVDSKEYDALPYGNAAFTASGKPEAELISAMRRGKEFTVQWTSKAGEVSSDTYSLMGFIDAQSTIDKECR